MFTEMEKPTVKTWDSSKIKPAILINPDNGIIFVKGDWAELEYK